MPALLTSLEVGREKDGEEARTVVDENRPKRAAFRVRRIYYDQIVQGTKPFELRRASVRNIHLLQGASIAVFVCGKDVHRRWINSVDLIPVSEVPRLLGRPISEQGLKDLGLDQPEAGGSVLKVSLGDVFT